MNRKNDSILKHPLLICIGIIMAATLAGYIALPQTGFSQLENRYLEQRPALTLDGLRDGSFMNSFETYSAEQIPFRTFLVKAKSAAQLILLKCENDGVAKGKDGYLFDKTLATNPQFEKNIDIMEKFIWDSGRNVTVAIAPTSTEVNSRRVPGGMPILDEKAMNEYVLNELSSCDNAKVIDVFDTLEDYSSEDLYYRTDHHWKTITAYYTYCDICKEFGTEPVDIMKLDKHTAEEFYGTFYSKYKGLGVQPDTIEYYDIPIVSYETPDGTFDTLYDEEKLQTYDKYAMFMRGNFGEARVNCSNGNEGKSLLVFKDSYANCLIPFFAMNYDTIKVVDLRYFAGSVVELLSENQNADILMLYNYSFINDDNHFYKLLK